MNLTEIYQAIDLQNDLLFEEVIENDNIYDNV